MLSNETKMLMAVIVICLTSLGMKFIHDKTEIAKAIIESKHKDIRAVRCLDMKTKRHGGKK